MHTSAPERRISSFSVLLVSAALSVVGLALMPRMKVQADAEVPQRTVSVGVGMAGASAKTLESEVTSRVEGVLAGISGVTDIQSVSRDGSGWITLSFAKGTDMQAARFEVSSQIRSVWPSLPDGASYPSISLSASGRKAVTAISYVVKGPMPPREIASYIERFMLPRLSMLSGVEKVNLGGDTPYHYVIEFDRALASSLGISASEIASAFRSSHHDEVVGIVRKDNRSFDVRLKAMDSGTDFGDIPVKKVGGRIVHLRDLATWRYCESAPTSHFRLNGLNTVTVSFDISPDSNLISVTDAIKKAMDELGKSFPDGVSATVGHDSSQYMRGELRRIFARTSLCLLLLLLFVLVASRSWRYLLLISITLAVNLLASVALYALFDLRIHSYTLAGITVSLGIIIDTSIVMVDHWRRCRDRSVFIALVGAVLTTVSSLSVIFFLPDSERAALSDFAGVIAVNLSVSLLVAWFFVPALMEYLPVPVRSGKGGGRRAVKWLRRYSGYISWGSRHRALLIVAAVAAFGIPTFLLPQGESQQDLKWWQKPGNAVAQWKPYHDHRDEVDCILGSSFGLFHRSMSRADFYRKPHEKVLSISAGMPDGCSVAQLDEIVRKMENYLSQFDGIDRYVTNIWSYDNASIEVYFKPEVASGWFPSELKSKVTSMAISYGGATWRISGVDERSFNNDVTTQRFSNSIRLSGYSYDDLLEYADMLVQELSSNRRVSNPQIWSSDNRATPEAEMHIEYDFAHMTAVGASPYRYYSALSSPLYSSRVGSVLRDGSYVGVDLLSSDRESLDAWHIANVAVDVDSLGVKLLDMGNLEKRLSGIPVRRRNQSYYVSVRYDYIGNWMQSEKMEKALVAKFNGEILPMGFRADRPARGWFNESRNKYAGIILLTALIIFVICCVIFESLRLPFAVILMIPISFIGAFLAFGWSRASFDQGGFAAFVMLSGLVVNAAIYIICEWMTMMKNGYTPFRAYVRAFGNKVWPITLTLISTALGLIPFLMDGPEDVFWYDFALGTISGLTFSVVAILLYLPTFIMKR